MTLTAGRVQRHLPLLHDLGQRWRRAWRRRPPWPDLVAAVCWVTVLWLLVGSDGGRWPGDQPLIVAVSVVVAVSAARSLAGAPPGVPALVLASAGGLLVSLALGGVRAGWVHPTVSTGIGIAMGSVPTACGSGRGDRA